MVHRLIMKAERLYGQLKTMNKEDESLNECHVRVENNLTIVWQHIMPKCLIGGA